MSEKYVLTAGDFHCGHIVGLTPPEWQRKLALESTTKRLEKTHHISLLIKKTELEDLNRTILLLQGKVFQILSIHF